MKLKYFLRGLGAGIVFSALIMLAAYMTTDAYKISDEEVIKRAEKLGMVMEDNSIIASTEDKGSSEDTKEEDTTEEITTEATTETRTEETTAEAITTEATTEEVTETAVTTELVDGVTITVRPGMSSYEVAVILKDAKIIKDADDFDSYLNDNGYSTKIEVGDFICNSNMSYEELAKILTKSAN